MTSQTSSRAALLLIPSAALVLAAVIAAFGFLQSKRADRFVTVKGVAEVDVEADLVVWPIAVSVTDDDLGTAQRTLNASLAEVVGFLAEFGVDSTAVSWQGTQVTDRLADRYSRLEPGQLRYIVSATLSVRSEDLESVDAAYEGVGRLIEAGIPLSSPGGYGELRPTYIFTRLNDVKPGMIADATGSAREAAEQFALDSGSDLGGIRRANQGVFEILPRTPGIPESYERFKQVRVVSTIEYYLDG